MSQQTHHPIICLAGPTATGKTELALRLVKHFPLEIISVDSALIYRDLDIGTAKPDADTLKQIPHHLINICSPEESYSAAHFCKAVERLVPEILTRGNIPLLVGGTMLYFQALLKGLSELPPADEQIRLAILDEAKTKGWAQLHAQLHLIDPKAAVRIHPNDPQRLQRALEVYRLTGQPLSAWQEKRQGQSWDSLCVGLMPSDRDLLRTRIDARFEHMLAAGFLDEVVALRAKYKLHANLPAMRSVGYRQAWQYLEKQCDYADFVLQAKAATRQLAKRQMTWLRQSLSTELLDPNQPDLDAKLAKSIQTWLTNKAK